MAKIVHLLHLSQLSRDMQTGFYDLDLIDKSDPEQEEVLTAIVGSGDPFCSGLDSIRHAKYTGPFPVTVHGGCILYDEG